MKIRATILISVFMLGLMTFAISSGADGQCKGSADINPVYSKLVYPGPDGKLVYTPDEKGNIIPDFSYAGYGGGGVKIPDVSVKVKVSSVEGDNTANVQNAIDKVSAMPLDKKGFRGAVLLKKGFYSIEKPIHISVSGVVIRGEGMDEKGTVLFGKGFFKNEEIQKSHRKLNFIIVEGSEGIREIAGTSVKITDEYVPVGARSFNVENNDEFKAGDKIIVRRHSNKDWVHELGMDQDKNNTWEPFNLTFDRIVTKVEGNKIFFDAPLVCAIESRWGGGEIVKYDEGGRICNVGIENLRGISDFDSTVKTDKFGNTDRENYVGFEYFSDENHYWNFIHIDNLRNGWVRNVTALHFAGGTVFMAKGSKCVTVQDCVTVEPVSFTAGVRRFTYQITGQQCFVQRCFSDRGRHSFVLCDSTATGPNVFLDCEITRPYSTSEPHSVYVTGCLYDNVKAPLSTRFWKNIMIGWAGANCVMWNCEGMFLVQKPPTAQNYSIGHIGIHAVVFNTGLIDYTKENGYIESLDMHVSPRSLYLNQLENRLGKKAVKNIAIKAQM
jgi:hypothetical protein